MGSRPRWGMVNQRRATSYSRHYKPFHHVSIVVAGAQLPTPPCGQLVATCSAFDGPVAAAPGYSNHQHGQALDIDMVDSASKRWMFANGQELGWKNTVPSESWHWEYFGS